MLHIFNLMKQLGMAHACVFFLTRAKHVANTFTPIEKAIQEVAQNCAKENFNVIWITNAI
jgi:hypothetical protein